MIDTLISTLVGLINAFTSVVSGGVNLANYYSNNWGKLIVYGGLIFVASKIFKVKLAVQKGR
ncbi:hypothetical protein LPY66_11305 [Dehalobacter sp. DCM]|uniref:hypothetical protein n=1 Tax=Dehalobacter sp. DCM TaxID=2907827 RepID=UPI0030812037|nr:hypothetical protein LPY66_11305 [Dehalobacter sp. DCM]